MLPVVFEKIPVHHIEATFKYAPRQVP